MNVKYERQLKKGALEILVLQLLSKERMYGYQMIMEMKNRSHGLFEMKEGTLYPILYRLEDDGFIKSEWSEPKNKEMSRKYYVITLLGIETLKELKELWKEFSTTVNQMLGDDYDE